MKLAYWMYAGPAHIGVLRVSSSFKNVHAIMHAPLGDDYFNVMRSMLERERDFTPVTASIVDRHVLARGSQEKVVENITRKNKEETPDLILLTPTCTSSILQEDLHNFVERSTLNLTNTENNSNNNLTIGTAPNENLQLSYTMQENNVNQDANDTINLTSNENLRSSMRDAPASAEYKYPFHFVQSKKNNNFVINERRDSLEGNSFDTTPTSPDVILADVNHYRVNELQAADRTLEQIVRYYILKAKKNNTLDLTKTEKPSVNIIGIFTLGFHNIHDCRELKRLFNDLGININLLIPEGGDVQKLKNLPQAWFNFVPYREVGLMTAEYLKSEFNMPYVAITPMGLVDTAACIRSILKIITNHLQLANVPADAVSSDQLSLNHDMDLMADQPLTSISDQRNEFNKKTSKDFSSSHNKLNAEMLQNLFNNYIDQQTRFVSQAAWFSRSIDCQNLTGKKVVVFGDATHAAAMTKILAREMGIHVVCAGSYCTHDADWFREQVTGFCDKILITDDHKKVNDTIAKLEPAAIFGTQMERHVGKRLDIPCGVISAPVHIQNFPLGYRPFLGYEGTNQIADLVYNSFNLGMEDHLLQIFGGHDSVVNVTNDNSKNPSETLNNTSSSANSSPELWSSDGLVELNKVPGFVRGKVKRNTEKYALQNNISVITVEVMYAAKEALSA